MDRSRLPLRAACALSAVLVVGLLSIGFALVSCSSLERARVSVPGVEGATFVGNKACVDCHANITRLFPSSPHARIHLSDLPRGRVQRLRIVSWGGQSARAGWRRREISLSIPAGSRQPASMPRGGARAIQASAPSSGAGGADELCAMPRSARGRHFQSIASHRPRCARPTGLARLNETCAQCHREQARQSSTSTKRCAKAAPSATTRTARSPTRCSCNGTTIFASNAMRRCRAVSGDLFIGDVPHTTFVSRGACWSAGCHTAVHGSNIDRALRH